MDNIKKAIECPNCHEILDTPVLLPCWDSVCKKHTENQESIRCGLCSKEHKVSPEGFPVNKNLETLIKSEIDKLDFGDVHSEAIRSCHALDEYLKEVEAVISSPLKPTRERIADIKKSVARKGEDLKIKVDKEVRDFFNRLDEYEKQSERYLSTDEYSKESNKLDKSVKAAQYELIDWKDTLNKIKLDELKWRNIVNESNAKKSNIRVDLENLKNRFFFINYDEIESRVKFFEQIDITSKFKYTGPTSNPIPSHTPNHTPSQTPNSTHKLSHEIATIRKPSVDQTRVAPLIKPNSVSEPRIFLDSKIIINELPVRLEALLKEAHMNLQKWGLCYRGSRDGFSAKEFHEKCDEMPDTLTIVKTTSGCIFGGYSRATWSSTECYKFEKGAFVFSLSNKLNKPMVFTQIAGDQRSIHCDPSFGPCFGGGPDFRISDACDSNENSLSRLGSSFTNDDLKKTPDLASTILADGETFQVSEIEVFHRKKFAYLTQAY